MAPHKHRDEHLTRLRQDILARFGAKVRENELRLCANCRNYDGTACIPFPPLLPVTSRGLDCPYFLIKWHAEATRSPGMA